MGRKFEELSPLISAFVKFEEQQPLIKRPFKFEGFFVLIITIGSKRFRALINPSSKRFSL